MAKAKQQGTRKRYTDKQKATILAYAREHGVTAASKKFKVTTTSLYEWRNRAEGTKKSPARVKRRTSPAKIRAAEGTSGLPTDVGELQALVVELLVENHKLRE